MAERLNNDFQFLDVARQDPEKKDITVRKAEFVEYYCPQSRVCGNLQAIYSGNRCQSDTPLFGLRQPVL